MSLESGLKKLSELRGEVKESAARERLAKLLDDGSFAEFDVFAKSAEVITGHGTIEGAPVCVFSQDVSKNDGAMGKAQAEKIKKVYDFAVKTGVPVIGIYDSRGAALKEGMDALSASGELMLWVNNLSGVVPQVSLILGTCGGSAALIASSADVVIASQNGRLFLNANEEDSEGALHIVTEKDDEAIAKARQVVSMLPLNNLSESPMVEFSDPAPYAGGCPIEASVDAGSFVEFQADFGKSAVVGLATVGGQTVAIAGVKGMLDPDSSAKLARQVRLADAFAIPVVSFVDCEGFTSVREASKVAHAYAEATTAKVTFITGNAYGAAYIALAGKGANADLSYAWAGAAISALKPEAAVSVLWNDRLAAMKEPLTERAKLVEEYKDTDAAPFAAAESGCIDEVIAPEETRAKLIAALDVLAGKRISRLPKKHSNIQL